MFSADRLNVISQWINLFVPGGGLILSGHVTAGLMVGVFFGVLCNLAILASLVVPDEFSRSGRSLCILSAALVYILAQFLLIRAHASDVQVARNCARRSTLRQAAASLEQGDAEAARVELEALRSQSKGDLHVAVCHARALSAGGDSAAAIRAWEAVREIDKHHIYRDEHSRWLQALRETSAAPRNSAS